MAKLGVGVLGVGTMGMRHAFNLRALIPEAQLVGVADADLERAKAAANELEIDNYFSNVEEMAARDDVQAVVIATPAKFHAEAMMACIHAGKDIFCEKPFTLTLADADNVLNAIEKKGVRVQVGHVRRYDPPNVRAKARIEAGEIGDPIIFKSLARDPSPPPVSYMSSGLNGMLFQDSTVHEFDLGRWLMDDEISEVHAYGAVLVFPEIAQFNDIDTALLNMRFSRGALGAVENYMQSGYGYDVRTEIVGSKGTIITGYLQQTAELVLTRSGARTDIVDHFLTRFADGYLHEVRDFVQTLLAGSTPRVNALDGRQAVAVAEAAERSYRENRVISVENRVRPVSPSLSI
jgi:scyllo-inositol 2-dehydrogenase (NAD+)